MVCVGGSMYPQPRKIKLLAKKNRILNEVFRDGGCSRFDLARRLNINAAMVGTYVAEFLEAKENPMRLKNWINSVLGETWEERGGSWPGIGLCRSSS